MKVCGAEVAAKRACSMHVLIRSVLLVVVLAVEESTAEDGFGDCWEYSRVARRCARGPTRSTACRWKHNRATGLCGGVTAGGLEQSRLDEGVWS